MQWRRIRQCSIEMVNLILHNIRIFRTRYRSTEACGWQAFSARHSPSSSTFTSPHLFSATDSVLSEHFHKRHYPMAAFRVDSSWPTRLWTRAVAWLFIKL